MSKLKAIKKLLKQNKQWSEYKKKYAHKQMRLVSSRVSLIYKEDLTVEKLYALEVKMLEAKKADEEEMFLEVFKNFNDFLEVPKVDWKAFAKYLWYVYQTSTYWKDSKKKRPNTFNTKNYIEKNQIKRAYYSKWVESIDLSIPGANERLTRVMKEVF